MQTLALPGAGPRPQRTSRQRPDKPVLCPPAPFSQAAGPVSPPQSQRARGPQGELTASPGSAPAGDTAWSREGGGAGPRGSLPSGCSLWGALSLVRVTGGRMLCLSRCRWPEVPCQNSTRRKPGEPSWCRWPSDRGTGLRGSGPARPGLQTPGLRTAASPPPQPTPTPISPRGQAQGGAPTSRGGSVWKWADADCFVLTGQAGRRWCWAGGQALKCGRAPCPPVPGCLPHPARRPRPAVCGQHAHSSAWRGCHAVGGVSLDPRPSLISVTRERAECSVLSPDPQGPHPQHRPHDGPNPTPSYLYPAVAGRPACPVVPVRAWAVRLHWSLPAPAPLTDHVRTHLVHVWPCSLVGLCPRV